MSIKVRLVVTVGDCFERLTVTGIEGLHCHCACTCGTLKRVYKYDLLNGKTRSCGCLNAERSRTLKAGLKHGFYGTKIHCVWESMINRCYRPYDSSYPNYGERGITVAEEWRGPAGFLRFREHVGPMPSTRHQVDRIDNDGNYEPGNVRWATPTENSRNRRNTFYITAFGETKAAADWADEVGISRYTLKYRVKHGWAAEDALTRIPDVTNR